MPYGICVDCLKLCFGLAMHYLPSFRHGLLSSFSIFLSDLGMCLQVRMGSRRKWLRSLSRSDRDPKDLLLAVASCAS